MLHPHNVPIYHKINHINSELREKNMLLMVYRQVLNTIPIDVLNDIFKLQKEKYQLYSDII